MTKIIVIIFLIFGLLISCGKKNDPEYLKTDYETILKVSN